MAAKRLCLWFSVVLTLLNAVALAPVLLLLSCWSHRVSEWAILWYGNEVVREGAAAQDPAFPGNMNFGLYFQKYPTRTLWRTVKYSFQAVYGLVYFPFYLKTMGRSDVSVEAGHVTLDMSQFFFPDDTMGQFCRSLLDYLWTNPHHTGAWFPQNRGTRADMDAFVRMCRKEYPRLGEEERRLLEPFTRQGRVPSAILVPGIPDLKGSQDNARRMGLPDYAAEKLTHEELVQHIRESLTASTWKNAWPEPPPAAADWWGGLDLRRVRRIPADWKEVGRAVRSGEITRFDAGALLPRGYFNLTAADIAEMEGEAASTISVLSDGCTATSLQRWGERVRMHLKRGTREYWSMANLHVLDSEQADVNDLLNSHLYQLSGLRRDDWCDTGYINTRRLPKFFAGLPDVAKGMGLEEEVLRTQSFLWMGALRGGTHYDEEANVYVQLTGETDVLLVHQNFTNALTGGARRFEPLKSWPDKDPYVRSVPIHVFRLRPGDGLTFPGYNYHLFNAQSPDRISLNFFFIPQWRRLENSPSDWYSQERKRMFGDIRLALRQLWARSFARMWDEERRSIVWMASKNEYL